MLEEDKQKEIINLVIQFEEQKIYKDKAGFEYMKKEGNMYLRPKGEKNFELYNWNALECEAENVIENLTECLVIEGNKKEMDYLEELEKELEGI